jgi:fumarate hydratase, class I
MATPEFIYQEPFPLGQDPTEFYLFTREGITISDFQGKPVLCVTSKTLEELARVAFSDVSYMLRTSHLEQMAAILQDPGASENDRYVALTMLLNAEVSAKRVLPFCQDTGTATVVAKKGQQVWTDGDDAASLSKGIFFTYTNESLRYSQTIPLDMYREKNSGNNLPAQIDIYASPGQEYNFLFIAKGGGSANKTALYQETKALLNPASLEAFLIDKLKGLGTAACPPYHVAFVIGGTSAESCLKTVKLASARYLDGLPDQGNERGQAFRDTALEQKILEAAYELGIGAQFGGKHFALDLRIIRLPRHGASCPVGMGVSCAADRNIKAKINSSGVWVEKLEANPGRFIPERLRKMADNGGVAINLNKPMPEILADLSQHPVGTRLSLTGTIIVGRDIAHARLKDDLDAGKGLPQYIKDHPIYYAGPAKQPEGMASGSFGPTTAGRMDSYVDLFQQHGGSMVMIAKGNRSQKVTDACKRNGGFYLGSIGGPAAILAQENIKKVELLEYPELGMEAIYQIVVKDFPAFILVDDKGNDFYRNL